MPEPATSANVAVVDNPFQLLNAVEAVHALGLTRVHLIIVAEPGPQHPFAPLVALVPWASVHRFSFTFDTDPWTFPILGARLASGVAQLCSHWTRIRRRRRLERVLAAFGPVETVLLGHYWADQKPFMRHIANRLAAARLCLLDDGTDTIDINRRRKAEGARAAPARRPRLGLRARLRARYFDWDTAEAPSLTFFTVYDLEVRAGDRVVRNDYRHLRGLRAAAGEARGVYFLGQCLVEDGCMREADYLDYLRATRAHLPGEPVLYVPHPRQDPALTDRIRRLPGFQIESFDVPVELAFATQGRCPRLLATFYCSALESCRRILGDGVPMIAFYIHPGHLLRLQAEAEGIYAYFERSRLPNFEVIRLAGLQPEPGRE